MEKAKAGRPSNNPSDDARDFRAKTLDDIGISYDQSSQWQKLAAVPKPQFEAALAASEKPTTNGIINAAFPAKPKPVSPEALWMRDDNNPESGCASRSAMIARRRRSAL